MGAAEPDLFVFEGTTYYPLANTRMDLDFSSTPVSCIDLLLLENSHQLFRECT